jgi:hypothetical protein
MMSPKQIEPAVAWLQGFLHAFAWFNNKTNYGYTFTLDVLPRPTSVREAVEQHFEGDLESLTLTAVEDWRLHVKDLLARWLFEFRNPVTDHLKDPRQSFSLFHEHFREMLLTEVLGRFSDAVHPKAVWKVDVRTLGWYECWYEDLAFEESDCVLYLHLGHSD